MFRHPSRSDKIKCALKNMKSIKSVETNTCEGCNEQDVEHDNVLLTHKKGNGHGKGGEGEGEGEGKDKTIGVDHSHIAPRGISFIFHKKTYSPPLIFLC